jgi:hypothetical protein
MDTGKTIFFGAALSIVASLGGCFNTSSFYSSASSTSVYSSQPEPNYHYSRIYGIYRVPVGGTCDGSHPLHKGGEYIQVGDAGRDTTCLPKRFGARVDAGDHVLGYFFSLALFEQGGSEKMREFARLVRQDDRKSGKLGHNERLLAYRVEDAYKVQIDDASDDEIKLRWGTILRKKDDTYLGYARYSHRAVLFAEGKEWRLCVNRKVVPVEIVKTRNSDFEHSKIYDVIPSEVEDHSECQ